MRILRNGILPNKIILYQGVCTNCNAHIECEHDEINRIVKYTKSDIIIMDHYKCPTPGCNNNIQMEPIC